VSVSKRTLIGIALLIPPVAFYYLLMKSLLTVPLQDDYHAILGFLLQWKHESGWQHVSEILTYQHNDYRFMFENTIVGLQYTFLGHTNLRALSILGDLFVLPVLGVLYLIWEEAHLPAEYSLLAFIPVSWILFQLQYESTLNLPTPVLQFVPVMLFALLTCYLAPKSSTASFIGAVFSFLLAIASCANGLFLVPVGAAIYLQNRRYKRFLIWGIVSAVATIIYFHKYDFAAEQANTHMSNNIFSIFSHISLPYAAAFLGSIVAIRDPLPAILFGVLLICVLVFSVWDKLHINRPAIFYACVFIVITAVAVSGLRSNFGITAALGSRYRINSTVLLILIYFYLSEKFHAARLRPLIVRPLILAASLLLVVFTYESDRAGYKLLLAKRSAVETEMLRWERHEPRHSIAAAFPGDFTGVNEENGLFDPVEPILSDSIHEGIFSLPNLPTMN
jgi:hypothetical protein